MTKCKKELITKMCTCGKEVPAEKMAEIDKEWQEHLKKLNYPQP